MKRQASRPPPSGAKVALVFSVLLAAAFATPTAPATTTPPAALPSDTASEAWLDSIGCCLPAEDCPHEATDDGPLSKKYAKRGRAFYASRAGVCWRRILLSGEMWAAKLSDPMNVNCRVAVAAGMAQLRWLFRAGGYAEQRAARENGAEYAILLEWFRSLPQSLRFGVHSDQALTEAYNM
jgi:hypothetical protein